LILRRLGDAFARQDWFVVLIELIVLVLGIFIGLQVDDWNQARKDRKDETRFLEALHEDILLAEQLSSRVRERRLNNQEIILSANEVLFGRAGRGGLTDEECRALGSANYFNISVAGLPAVEELIATGRLGIIRNVELRSALIGLQQTRAALMTMVAVQSSQSAFKHLPTEFPDLIRTEAYFDEELGEIRNYMDCDLAGMRANQAFLNAWGANADGYDAYVRDGLRPWSDQFDKVHAIVDGILGVTH
jgi:hypothetical protein